MIECQAFGRRGANKLRRYVYVLEGNKSKAMW